MGRPCRAQAPGAPVPAGAPRQVTAGQLRERGNALFQAGDHAAALAAYTQALSLCDAEPERAVLHRNRAACYLKLVRAGRGRHRGRCRDLPGRPGLLGLRCGGCPAHPPLPAPRLRWEALSVPGQDSLTFSPGPARCPVLPHHPGGLSGPGQGTPARAWAVHVLWGHSPGSHSISDLPLWNFLWGRGKH